MHKRRVVFVRDKKKIRVSDVSSICKHKLDKYKSIDQKCLINVNIYSWQYFAN